MRTFLYGLAGLAVLVLVLTEGIWLVSHGKAYETDSSIATTTIAETTDTYQINIAYPTLGVAKADIKVKAIVDKTVSEFKAIPPNPTPISAKSELDGEFEIISSEPSILSVLMQIYQFTGGAHGGTTAYGLNFHPDGNTVTLDEALALTGKSLQEVAEDATKQLTEDFQMVQFPEGAAPTRENYSTFVIDKNSVTFIFQQYQVEAYVAGMPQITIPRVK